jgi:hypothetical protein
MEIRLESSRGFGLSWLTDRLSGVKQPHLVNSRGEAPFQLFAGGEVGGASAIIGQAGHAEPRQGRAAFILRRQEAETLFGNYEAWSQVRLLCPTSD